MKKGEYSNLEIVFEYSNGMRIIEYSLTSLMQTVKKNYLHTFYPVNVILELFDTIQPTEKDCMAH